MIDNPFGGGIKKAPGLLKIISPTFNLNASSAHDRGQCPRRALDAFKSKVSEMLQMYEF